MSTIKYYLREGLVPSGASRGATQADYGQAHVHRIRVIKALAEVAGLPIQKIRVVVGLIDEPGENTFDALGRAVAALPPYLQEAGAGSGAGSPYPLARAALQSLGQVFDPDYAAVAQLERALQAVADAGIPMGPERLGVYGRSLMEMAEYDVAGMPGEPAATVEHAVLGTALYEPVILALRRLAHQDAASRRLDGPPGP